MNPLDPTLEDLQRLLTSLGIRPGVWGEQPEKLVTPESVLRQQENLVKLRGMLEMALGQDQAALGALQEQLTRLKHGGGS